MHCPAIPLVALDGDNSFANLQTRAPIPLRSPQRTVRYEIGAAFDAKRHVVRGSERVHWRNRSAATVCTLYLHLDLNAFESYGTRYMSAQRARGIDIEVPSGEWGYSDLTQLRQDGVDVPWIPAPAPDGPAADRSVVRMDLPFPVPPGETATLDIGFVSRLPGDWAPSGHSGDFTAAFGWFPQIATLQLPGEQGAPALRWNAPAYIGSLGARERADFDVQLEMPYGYVAASSGEARGAQRARNGRRLYRYTQEDATTFAWATDPQFFAQPLEYVYYPSEGGPVTLRVFYRPGHTATAVNVLGTMADALSRYTLALGAYPTHTLTAVVASDRTHALSNRAVPGLFTARTPDAGANGALQRDVLGAIGLAYLPEGTDDAFRNGVQRYWSTRFLQAENGGRNDIGTGHWLRDLVAPWITAFSAERAHVQERLDAEATRANHVARVLHDLEQRIGAPAMDRAFRAWRRGARAGYPDTGQVRWLMADGSGRADVFLHAFAIMDAGLAADDRIVRFASNEELPQPGYVLRGDVRTEATEDDVRRAIRATREQWRRHPRGARPFPYRTEVVVQRDGAKVPQTLTVAFADGSTRSVQWDDMRNPVRFEWNTPSPAVSAQLDPQRQVTLDPDKLDDGRTVQADLSPVRRWGEAVAAWVEIAATWVALL
ncbi:gluzincin family metallopeptidase [Lysobacter terrae]